MIFILTEQIMNGTVTMKINTTLIEADNFEGAYLKLKSTANWNDAESKMELNDSIRYFINGKIYRLSGELQKKPARVI